MIKRLIDFSLASLAMLTLAPIFFIIAAFLKLTGEGDVFYLQERIGRYGRPFRLVKFATMLRNSPNLPGGLLTSQNDPRILPGGRFLRASKINELPQLLNVVVGDMSLIGPRPQVREHFLAFPEAVRKCILGLRPGLSGIGSIAFRDEEAMLAQPEIDAKAIYEQEIAPYKGALEVWYAARQSTVVDLQLMALTVLAVIWPDGGRPYRWFPDLPRPETVHLARWMHAEIRQGNWEPP